jgi:hypothetical protein
VSKRKPFKFGSQTLKPKSQPDHRSRLPRGKLCIPNRIIRDPPPVAGFLRRPLMLSRIVPFAIFGAVALFVLHFYHTTTDLVAQRTGLAMAAPSNGLSDLSLTLSQASQTPPTIKVKLSNSSPSTSYTVLTWDTPFDQKAIALGIFRIVDASSGTELPAMNMKLNRKLPPPRDALIEISPGNDVTQDVVFEKPLANLEQGKSYEIQAKGSWKAVWPRTANQVDDSDLGAMAGGSDCLTGPFESNKVAVAAG